MPSGRCGRIPSEYFHEFILHCFQDFMMGLLEKFSLGLLKKYHQGFLPNSLLEVPPDIFPVICQIISRKISP